MIRPSQVTHVTRPMRPVREPRGKHRWGRVAQRAERRRRDRNWERGVNPEDRLLHVTRPRVASRRQFLMAHADSMYGRRYDRMWADVHALARRDRVQRQAWDKSFADYLTKVMESTAERVTDTMQRDHLTQQNEGLKGLFRTLEEPLPPGHYELEQHLEEGKVVYRFAADPLIRPLPHGQAEPGHTAVPLDHQAVVRSDEPREVPSSQNDPSTARPSSRPTNGHDA